MLRKCCLLATVAMLGACSRLTTPPSATATSPPAPGSAPAPTAAAMAPAPSVATTMESGAVAPFDARFIDSMIPHHEMAVEMSKDALPNLQHAELRELAQRIVTAQEREIAMMRDWRTQWYGQLAPTSGLGMPMMGTSGPLGVSGATSATDHATLMAAIKVPGGASDAAYLDAMIPHHEAAIPMAQDCLTHCEHQELKTLAQSIIDTQQSEIAEMRAWRREWLGR